MHYEDLEKDHYVDLIIKDMEAGLAGEPADFMMIPTYITTQDQLPQSKPVIVIDAGGTNLRVGLVTIKDGENPIIEHHRKHAMLGTDGEITKDEFYNTLVDYIEPLLPLSDTISFCFSFATEILPNQDGKVLYLSKEVYIKGIEGSVLGEEINEVLAKRNHDAKKVVVLNDTVAAMLSAIGHPKAKGHKGNMGFILGTGMNACYAEKVSNITKIQPIDNISPDDKMVINIEAGLFNGFPQGTADKRLDETTKDPGTATYEKMASGAYRGQVMYYTAQIGVEEGLFSEGFEEELVKEHETFHLWDIEDFAASPFGDNKLSKLCKTNSDRQRLAEIIMMINHRAAVITVIMLSAVLTKGGIGNNPETPAAIVAEGTTFYKSASYQMFLKEYTKEYMNEHRGLYLSYLHVEDAIMLGTAVSGLLANR